MLMVESRVWRDSGLVSLVQEVMVRSSCFDADTALRIALIRSGDSRARFVRAPRSSTVS